MCSKMIPVLFFRRALGYRPSPDLSCTSIIPYFGFHPLCVTVKRHAEFSVTAIPEASINSPRGIFVIHLLCKYRVLYLDASALFCYNGINKTERKSFYESDLSSFIRRPAQGHTRSQSILRSLSLCRCCCARSTRSKQVFHQPLG